MAVFFCVGFQYFLMVLGSCLCEWYLAVRLVYGTSSNSGSTSCCVHTHKHTHTHTHTYMHTHTHIVNTLYSKGIYSYHSSWDTPKYYLCAYFITFCGSQAEVSCGTPWVWDPLYQPLKLGTYPNTPHPTSKNYFGLVKIPVHFNVY